MKKRRPVTVYGGCYATVRLISSLEKCFHDSELLSFTELKRASVLKNQPFSFQILYKECEAPAWFSFYSLRLVIDGVDKDAVTLRTVESIPSKMPVFPGVQDENYLRTAPGLYPDLLKPLPKEGIPVFPLLPSALWVDIAAGTLPVGAHDLKLTLYKGEATVATLSLALEVIDALLPEVDLLSTQWFHADCLADYYHVPMFSEEHWRIIGNFMEAYVAAGNNMILVPALTPPTDTAVGGERPTVQLVDVTYLEGKYTFGFDRFDRYIALAESKGIHHFEINHLFTQWGAKHAPKVIAMTEEGEKRIFGWETDGAGKEYHDFLTAFLPALRAHLDALGIAERTIFHISDEPNETNFESYGRAKENVGDLLDGCYVGDALSHVEYYEKGLVAHPIAASDAIQPFLAHGIRDMWVYYCCGQNVGVSNRYFAMPLARTRYMGTQLFLYDIKGFLQWGFNFYFSRHSIDSVDPFLDSTGGGFTPSGDCYTVYPAPDGTAWDSVRGVAFREGIEDLRAMTLAASLVGKDKVIETVEAYAGKIVFDRCVCDSKTMLALREAVNTLIKENL